jgi:hypothetical protein
MLSATGYVPAFDMPEFTTYDASSGIAKGGWAVQLYGQNLTNVNSSLSTSSGQVIVTKVPPAAARAGCQI